MACELCTIRPDVEPRGDQLIGEWCFDESDDLTHKASGRIGLWYDFDDEEWAILVLIDDGGTERGHLPSVAQFKADVCPFCGRRLQVPRWVWCLELSGFDAGEDVMTYGCVDPDELRVTYSRGDARMLFESGWRVCRHLVTEYGGDKSNRWVRFAKGACVDSEDVPFEDVWGALNGTHDE